QSRHQAADSEPQAFEIDHDVNHDLARAVVGNLTAAVNGHNLDVAGGQNMFGAAVAPLREYRFVVQKPELVVVFRAATGRKTLHGTPHGLIGPGRPAKAVGLQYVGGRHRDMTTRSSALRS